MATTENLIPQNKRTKEEQRKIATLGGIKSQKVQKEKKLFKESLRAILEESPDILKSLNDAMVQQATKGNTKAYEIIRDTLGEKPVNESITDITSGGETVKMGTIVIDNKPQSIKMGSDNGQEDK